MVIPNLSDPARWHLLFGIRNKLFCWLLSGPKPIPTKPAESATPGLRCCYSLVQINWLIRW